MLIRTHVYLRHRSSCLLRHVSKLSIKAQVTQSELSLLRFKRHLLFNVFQTLEVGCCRQVNHRVCFRVASLKRHHSSKPISILEQCRWEPRCWLLEHLVIGSLGRWQATISLNLGERALFQELTTHLRLRVIEGENTLAAL